MIKKIIHISWLALMLVTFVLSTISLIFYVKFNKIDNRLQQETYYKTIYEKLEASEEKDYYKTKCANLTPYIFASISVSGALVVVDFILKDENLSKRNFNKRYR